MLVRSPLFSLPTDTFFINLWYDAVAGWATVFAEPVPSFDCLHIRTLPHVSPRPDRRSWWPLVYLHRVHRVFSYRPVHLRITISYTTSSELDGLMDTGTRRSMVRLAKSLRSLLRVKIADDADLMQAKSSLHMVESFFHRLTTKAAATGCSAIGLFQKLEAI